MNLLDLLMVRGDANHGQNDVDHGRTVVRGDANHGQTYDGLRGRKQWTKNYYVPGSRPREPDTRTQFEI